MSSLYEHAGFTGTRRKITDIQRTLTRLIVAKIRPEHVHHGCCIGGDEMFHEVCEPFGMTRWLHRPLLRTYEAKLVFNPATDMRLERLPYADRNQEIIGCSGVLIATPKEKVEILRSGTWMTIRFARMARRPAYIIFPDGVVRYERVPVEHRLGTLL